MPSAAVGRENSVSAARSSTLVSDPSPQRDAEEDVPMDDSEAELWAACPEPDNVDLL